MRSGSRNPDPRRREPRPLVFDRPGIKKFRVSNTQPGKNHHRRIQPQRREATRSVGWRPGSRAAQAGVERRSARVEAGISENHVQWKVESAKGDIPEMIANP